MAPHLICNFNFKLLGRGAYLTTNPSELTGVNILVRWTVTHFVATSSSQIAPKCNNYDISLQIKFKAKTPLERLIQTPAQSTDCLTPDSRQSQSSPDTSIGATIAVFFFNFFLPQSPLSEHNFNFFLFTLTVLSYSQTSRDLSITSGVDTNITYAYAKYV